MANNVKLVVFVPETHAEAVRQAMGGAGAGRIGNYSFCSFSAKGVGRFKPEVSAPRRVQNLGIKIVPVVCGNIIIRAIVIKIWLRFRLSLHASP